MTDCSTGSSTPHVTGEAAAETHEQEKGRMKAPRPFGGAAAAHEITSRARSRGEQHRRHPGARAGKPHHKGSVATNRTPMQLPDGSH